jgi:hypothetical protein
MILEAKRELAKQGKDPKKDPTEQSARTEKPPSMFSGVALIFIGSFVFSIFVALGQMFIGFLASAAFVIIGMFRITKANAARYKKEKMPEDS